jgi:purine nucleosidase
MKACIKGLIPAIFVLFSTAGHAQERSAIYNDVTVPRMRVMIDNDFGGDPDGLFALVHHLLSPSVEVRGIIGSHLYKKGFFDSPGTAARACEVLNQLLKTLALNKKPPVYEGANSGLPDLHTASVSAGAKAIVSEALRTDTKLPLYVVCGAGLTTIASAWLMDPEIAKHIVLIWIGGPEYSGIALPPPGYRNPEYNLGIDIKACQVVFNNSDIPVWQIPRDAYRQCIVSYPELLVRVSDKGETGKFLCERLGEVMKKMNKTLGETYILGDSPLVLLTALQSPWEADPSSSKYILHRAPKINDSGLYDDNPDGRFIRVYTDLDTRLLFEDFFAKIVLHSKEK